MSTKDGSKTRGSSNNPLSYISVELGGGRTSVDRVESNYSINTVSTNTPAINKVGTMWKNEQKKQLTKIETYFESRREAFSNRTEISYDPKKKLNCCQRCFRSCNLFQALMIIGFVCLSFSIFFSINS